MTTPPARWELVQGVFHDVLARPVEEREQFLRDTCEGDPSLLAEVQRLLDGDAQPTVLDVETAAVAHAVIGLTAPTELEGTRVGPYTLSSKLGEGGSGVVYLAERDDIGSQVAFKVLRDAWVSPLRRDRFVAEQRTLAKLSHPWIAAIVDAGVEGGVPWFAMEYVRGVPLDEYCRQQRLDLAGRVQLVRRVCHAVQYAHERLFVHRDLKPSNILVLPDGSPKLLDFGIAHHLAEVEAARTTIGPLRFLTAAYAAPEELRGEPSGVQADVYSLGAVLRELVDDLRTSGRVPRANPDLDALCAAATHVDTSRRYASVEALGRDLDAFLGGFPLAVRSRTLTYRATRFVGRHRPAVAAVLVVTTLVTGLVAYYTQQVRFAQTQTRAEAARAERLLHFVLRLFDGGVGEAPAADLKVVTLLERGVQEGQSLSSDPVAQAELFLALGGIYRELGDLDRADTLLTDALGRRRSATDLDRSEVAEALVALAELRVAQARLDEAAALVEEARTAGGAGPAQTALAAKALLTAGRIDRDRGDYASATTSLEAAIRQYETAPGDRLDLADALAALAEVRYYTGDLTAAAALNRRATDIIRAVRGTRHPDLAHGLLTFAAVAAAQAQAADAEAAAREALDILSAWYGEAHPETASAMTIVAQFLGQQGRIAEALPLLTRAEAVQADVFGVRHPRTAFVQNELGLTAFRLNDLPTAAAAFERAIAGYQGVDGKHFQEGVSRANLGSVFLLQGEHVRAETLFRQALAIYGEVLAPDHLTVAIARSKLGRALVRQQRLVEAEPELQAARAVLERQPGPPSTWLVATREDLSAVAAGKRSGRAGGR